MRESLMYGSVRGTRGNSRPYRDAYGHSSHRAIMDTSAHVNASNYLLCF